MKRYLLYIWFCLAAIVVRANDLPQYQWQSCSSGVIVSRDALQDAPFSLNISSSRYSSNVQNGMTSDPYSQPVIFRAPPTTTEDEETTRPGVDEPIGDWPWPLLALMLAAFCAFRRLGKIEIDNEKKVLKITTKN